MAGGIQLELAHAQHGGGGAGVSPQQRAHPRQQLRKGERLDQVVVGPVVEAGHPILERVAGGEHEHPGTGLDVMIGPDLAAHLPAVDARHGHVQAHQVVLVDGQLLERLGPRSRHVDRVAVTAQAPGHGLGQVGFVVDDQDPHLENVLAAGSVAPGRRRSGRAPLSWPSPACAHLPFDVPHPGAPTMTDHVPPTPTPAAAGPTPQTVSPARLEQAVFEVKKVIVGQDRAIERLLVCLLARGHALLEGVPGLAKTLAAETLATVVGGSYTRLQFTPDLLPADITGTRIYRASSERFDVELGPIFANFVLADEINRAPAKVQSALLEVMAEHHVSIGGTDLRRAGAVPRAGHPEPHRERGRLPPARGPARPVPDEDRHRLPEPGRGGRDRPPHGRAPAPRRPGARARRPAGPPEPGRRRLRRPRCGRVRGQPGAGHPPPGPVRAPRAGGPAGLRGQPPGQPRPGRRRPGPWPCCGAAPTPCPRTSTTWPPTCCATAWCRATRHWPRGSPSSTS